MGSFGSKKSQPQTPKSFTTHTELAKEKPELKSKTGEGIEGGEVGQDSSKRNSRKGNGFEGIKG
jgi:hypothetical protein